MYVCTEQCEGMCEQLKHTIVTTDKKEPLKACSGLYILPSPLRATLGKASHRWDEMPLVLLALRMRGGQGVRWTTADGRETFKGCHDRGLSVEANEFFRWHAIGTKALSNR